MSSPITAAEAASSILETLAAPRRQTTVDNFLAGDPATPVTGIAMTMMATMDVLVRAVQTGANFIVSHEPAFYDHRNQLTDSLIAENDPVYSQKAEYIGANSLVIWRLHDALHDMRPDLIDLGTIRQLGWPLPHADNSPALIDIEPIRLADLVTTMANTLSASAPRYIGNPEQQVSRVSLGLGFIGSDKIRHLLQDPHVDAVIVGEAHEWEVAAYAADAVSMGMNKALVVLGHIPSEQYGMAEAARVISNVLPGLPVSFLPCLDPYRAATQY